MNTEIVKPSKGNKSNKFLTVAAIVLAVAVCGLLVVHFTGIRYKLYVDKMETFSQTSNSIAYTNYSVIVKDKFDWNNVKDKNRERMAKYAVTQADKAAKKAGIRNYNVVGVFGKNKSPIFSYTEGGNIVLFVNGSPDKEIKMDK